MCFQRVLFENKDSFKYIPSQQKYQYILEGAIGGERLKNIFKYEQIVFYENTSTLTRAIFYLRIVIAGIK